VIFMLLGTMLKNKDEIQELIRHGVDVFVLETEAFTKDAIAPLELPDLLSMVKLIHELGNQAYVSINTIIHEQDSSNLRDYLSRLTDSGIDGILIFDLTVSIFAEELGIKNRCIYNPGTMNTASDEVTFLQNSPLKGLTISKEITLDEILHITDVSSKLELSLIGHGYLEMFTSRRELLTNYFLFQGWNLQTLRKNHPYFIEEELRDGLLCPIIEGSHGTTIYRPKKLFSMEAYHKLSSHLHLFLISRVLMEDEELYDSLDCYQGVLSEKEFLSKYSDSYDTGFFFKKTELKKGVSV